MKKIIFILFVSYLMISFTNIETTPVDVAESTLKINPFGEEIFYYGFAEGDQLIFNFEEVNGKELKEVEISEYPSASKFMDYKTKKIENKTISITKTGVYKFRFSNSAVTGRVCKFKIQRIPVSETTKNFNSSVYWKTVNDTTFYFEPEKYLVKSDTIVTNLTDQVAKVHSGSNLNGNRTTVSFTLPKNTIAWSYYIGVDQSGKEAYEQATKQLAKSSNSLAAKIIGFNPIVALMFGATSYLTTLDKGEDIDYYFVEGDNANLFLNGQEFYFFKKSKVINDYSKMTAPLYSGIYFLCLSNDNAVTGVEVTVKISALSVNQEWATRQVRKFNVVTKEEPYLKN